VTAAPSEPGRGAGVHARIEPSDVVRAAMAILRQDGLPGLTMRRLAARMSVDPAAFYHHFKDKASIVRAVGRAALAEIDVPPEEGFPTWRDWLVEIGRNYRAVLLTHPYLRGLIVDGDVPWTSLPVYATERRHLAEEGIPERLHHGLLETVHCYVLGASIMHADRASSRAEAAAATERFELGLRVLLDGLVERLRADTVTT
jgi:AcrR family transcriptional regulator